MADTSKITTDLSVDSPIKIDAKYEMDVHDRRYIDNQILGTETHVVNSLISGYTGTWGTLDIGSAPVVVGDCICLKANKLTKAVDPDLTASGTVIGVVLAAANPNGKVWYAIGGIIPDSTSGLGTGAQAFAICNPTTGRIQRAATVSGSDFVVGFVSTAGYVIINSRFVGAGASITSPTGSGLWHSTSTSLDVTAYKGTANQFLVTNGAATDTVWKTAAGDWIGPVDANVVQRINGATVPAAGSLTIGNTLQVSGTSALSYGPLNVAGGSNYVTGILPPDNGGTGISSPGAAGNVLTSNGTSWISAAPSGGGGSITWANDLATSTSSVQNVVGITGNAGTLSIHGGTWTVDTGTVFLFSQTTSVVNTATKNLVFRAQSANASSSSNKDGASVIWRLGSNTDPLVTPWTNPSVPEFDINYFNAGDTEYNLFSVSPTRFFNKTGVGGGVSLVNDNSWIAIGSATAQTIGQIAVGNNTTILAARDHLDLNDIAVLATNNSDYVFLGGDASLSHQSALTAVQSAGLITLTIGSTNTVIVQSSLLSLTTPIELALSGPQIQNGSGAPATTPPNGSFYLRTDGTATSTAYVRAAGVWAALGTGGGGATSPGGANRNVQFNDAGVFNGATNVNYAAGGTLDISSGSAVRFGTTPSTTSYLRFTNASQIMSVWGGAANVVLVDTDSGNSLYLGGTSTGTLEATNTYIQAGGNINLKISTTSYFTLSSTTASFSSSVIALGPGVVTHGSPVSGSGDFRVKNGWILSGRSSGGSDLGILNLDGSNFLSLGGKTDGSQQVTITYLEAANQVYMQVGAASQFGVQSGMVFVTSGNNFSVGTQSPSMNSATNTIFITNGLGASTGPTSGVYAASNSGLFTIWNSAANSGSGGTTKMRLSFKRWITGTPTAADRKLGVVLEDGSEWFLPLSTS